MENSVLHGFPDEPEPEACLEKQRVNNARELWTEEGQARSQRESQVLYRTHAAADRIFSNSRFATRICSYGIEGNLNNWSFCCRFSERQRAMIQRLCSTTIPAAISRNSSKQHLGSNQLKQLCEEFSSGKVADIFATAYCLQLTGWMCSRIVSYTTCNGGFGIILSKFLSSSWEQYLSKPTIPFPWRWISKFHHGSVEAYLSYASWPSFPTFTGKVKCNIALFHVGRPSRCTCAFLHGNYWADSVSPHHKLVRSGLMIESLSLYLCSEWKSCACH